VGMEWIQLAQDRDRWFCERVDEPLDSAATELVKL
jgi:hypothetical protein